MKFWKKAPVSLPRDTYRMGNIHIAEGYRSESYSAAVYTGGRGLGLIGPTWGMRIV